MINPDDILRYCSDNFDGIIEVNSWGERGIFYNPGGVLKRGVYGLTVKEKDGENDRTSILDRESVTTFEQLRPLMLESNEYAKEKFSKRK